MEEEEEEEGEIVNTEPEEGSQLSQDEGQELVVLFFFSFIYMEVPHKGSKYIIHPCCKSALKPVR